VYGNGNNNGVTMINMVCCKDSMTSIYSEISCFWGRENDDDDDDDDDDNEISVKQIFLLGLTSLLYISLCSNVSL
jgi:hypothetical protein